MRNLNDGISALSIAEGALKELAGIAVRHKELAEQAANGVYSSKQREALKNEANALVAEYNRIVESTAFNGRNLLDNSFQGVRVQAGYVANATLEKARDGGTIPVMRAEARRTSTHWSPPLDTPGKYGN